ncbi:putative ankyrin repeat-containing domain-containing protein [Rosa chinensis]|uniref:Putative ankyrin repeat-containing domain-containing protein n=1 Tax=Rosa chinensis TaxID=74649 RepID=A0A2P6PIG5_ROSCH|nr:putative ankyrin repeat-containing domain-containing protein [Rosa chinensis]
MSSLLAAENDAKEIERYIPFSNFVINGDWENAKECLTKLPDAITARYQFGATALHIAAGQGHLHILKELVLLMGQDDLQTKNAYGYTALHVAFFNGRFDIVKELLPLMGGVKDCHGNTVLHMALIRQQPHTVEWMVKLMKREDLELKNNDGSTALNIAVKKGNVSTIKELLPHDDDFDRYIPFTNAVIDGDWNNANYCLRDLDPYRAVRARDPRDGNENTALHLAIKHGHVDIVKELVSLMTQEDLEVKNADPSTGNLNADLSERAVVEMAKYMVEQNEILLARVLELENAFGDTPLHEAVSKGDMSIVEELVPSMRQEGFEIKNNNGFTALHQAVMNENVDIVKIIVRRMRREGLEVKGALGYTALHQAVEMGNMGIVKELVLVMRQEGLEVKNDAGSNALHLAVMENKNMDIVRELMSLMRPQAMEIKNGEGFTALGCAMELPAIDGDIWEMAKFMAGKNKKVFGMRSGRDIPVVWAAGWGKWKLTQYLYFVTPREALNGFDGAHFITIAIERLKALGKGVLNIIN